MGPVARATAGPVTHAAAGLVARPVGAYFPDRPRPACPNFDRLQPFTGLSRGGTDRGACGGLGFSRLSGLAMT